MDLQDNSYPLSRPRTVQVSSSASSCQRHLCVAPDAAVVKFDMRRFVRFQFVNMASQGSRAKVITQGVQGGEEGLAGQRAGEGRARLHVVCGDLWLKCLKVPKELQT